MRKLSARACVGLTLSAALTTALVGCAGEPAADTKTTGPITITVGNMPTPDRVPELKLFKTRVAQFEKANPEVTITGRETKFDVTTFQAMVAGRKLPTVMLMPFTEPQALIAKGQIADMTDALKKIGLTDNLNPTTLSVGQNADGKIFAVPINTYSIGLVYNRELFTKAGLDPDAPPKTWAEVETAAAKISKATDAAGFAQMTTNNTGGWMFTAETYSFGGTVQSADGTKVTFNDKPSTEVLQTLHRMRFEDKSMGANVLYDYSSIAQEYAAGRIGMYVASPDHWNEVITKFKFDPKKFGVGPMPHGTEGDKFGALTGGTVAVVSPTATPREQLAAAKWIESAYLGRYIDQDVAIAQAKADLASGNPVGLPGLSPVSQEAYTRHLTWIHDYINVPVENFRAYLDATDEPVISEPVNNAQQVYAALDSVVQTVLTVPNADIHALLTKAATDVQTKLDRG